LNNLLPSFVIILYRAIAKKITLLLLVCHYCCAHCRFVVLGLIHTASRAKPIQLGKQTYVLKWKNSRCTPNRTEPDRACSLADVCLYSPANYRFCCAIGLTSWCRSACFCAMSANTLDCEVLINVVHLRPTLWEQSDKNYHNRDLKLKLGRSGC